MAENETAMEQIDREDNLSKGEGISNLTARETAEAIQADQDKLQSSTKGILDGVSLEDYVDFDALFEERGLTPAKILANVQYQIRVTQLDMLANHIISHNLSVDELRGVLSRVPMQARAPVTAADFMNIPSTNTEKENDAKSS